MAEVISHTENSSLPDVRIGDIWQEQDPRQPRLVRVSDVRLERVQIHQVTGSNGVFIAAPRSTDRWAQRKRFNGKRTGYALHYRTDETVPK